MLALQSTVNAVADNKGWPNNFFELLFENNAEMWTWYENQINNKHLNIYNQLIARSIKSLILFFIRCSICFQSAH